MKQLSQAIAPTTPIAQREVMRRRVLAELRSQGPLARVELAQHIGVSAATITETVGALIQDGVLLELRDGERESGPVAARGRPRVRLGFDGRLGAVVGVWIGQDRVELTLVDAAGNRLAEQTVAIALKRLDEKRLIATLAGLVAQFRKAEARGCRVSCLGIACQGYIESEAGRVAWSPVLAGADIPLGPELAQRLRLPVVIDNDAAALALALAHRDRRLLTGRTACVMIGDGVGLGLLVDGRLYRGARSGGSEFGHIRLDRRGPQCRCGARGCIEATVADYAIWRDAELIRGRFETRGLPDETALSALADEARFADPALRTVYEAAGRTLADGVGILIQMLEPDHVVICGPGTRAEDLLRPAFEARLEFSSIPELRRLAAIRFAPFDPQLRTEGMVLKALEHLDGELAG